MTSTKRNAVSKEVSSDEEEFIAIKLLAELLCLGSFEEADLSLQTYDVLQFESSTILIILTMTKMLRDKLPNRDEFLQRCENVLIDRLGEGRASRLLLKRR